jgi:hypothetical protein
MSGEQEIERELALRISEHPIMSPQLSVMMCSNNQLRGLNLTVSQRLEVLLCGDQGYYNEDYPGYFINDFSRLELSPFPMNLLSIVDISRSRLDEMTLNMLFNTIRATEPLNEHSMAPYRQIAMGYAPYEGYQDSQQVVESGWEVTVDSPEGGLMFSPVLKNFPGYDMSYPGMIYRLHNYRDWWNMAQGGLIII